MAEGVWLHYKNVGEKGKEEGVSGEEEGIQKGCKGGKVEPEMYRACKIGKAPWEVVEMVRRLKVVDSLRDRVDVGKFFDDEGMIRMGKETVALWTEHYEEVS